MYNLMQYEKWLLTIGSLTGGLDYKGVIKWLELFDNIDEAFDAAMDSRDGMVAT